jgi:hypothetical protein
MHAMDDAHAVFTCMVMIRSLTAIVGANTGSRLLPCAVCTSLDVCDINL